MFFCGNQTIETETNQLCSMFCRKKGQDDVLPIQSEMIYLVAGWAYPSEKSWTSSVGMMTFPIWKVIKFMFQTTNHIYIYMDDNSQLQTPIQSVEIADEFYWVKLAKKL